MIFFISVIGWWIYRLWYRSIRVTVTGLPSAERPVIYGFWHQHIFMMIGFLGGNHPPSSLTALVSPSDDGKLLGRLLSKTGIGVLPGSSDSNPIEAFWRCVREVRAGTSLLISPDGPRGPNKKLKPGMIRLSELTRAPVCCVSAEYTSYWQLSSWDQFIIPKPFSRCKLHFSTEVSQPSQNNQNITSYYELLLNGSQTGCTVEKSVA